MSEPQRIAWTPDRILRLMSDADKQLFAQEMADAIQRYSLPDISHLTRFLARMLGQRAEEIIGWSASRMASELIKLADEPDVAHHLERALIALHFRHRTTMMNWFLDEWGVPHDDRGVVARPYPTLNDAKVRQSMAKGMAIYPHDQVRLYVATAGLACRDGWLDVLWSILNDGSLGQLPTHVVQPEAADPIAASTTSLDPLDHVLIKACVRSVAGELGALSLVQIEAAIQDLVSANSSRHHSYFHPGFIDGLMERPFSCTDPELNTERRCWKFAGYATALARRSKYPEITALLDGRRDDLTRMLGDHPRYIHVVGSTLLESLRQAARYSDIATLFSGKSLANGGVVFVRKVLTLVGELYRQRKITEVRLLLTPLEEAARLMANRLVKEEQAEIARRRAQILKAEGCFEAARASFDGLLPDADARHRSMIRSDIGLAKGSFKWLSEVQVPRDQSLVPDLKARIQSGLDDFAASAHEASGLSYSGDANGNFVMGVFELLNERYAQAESAFRVAYERAMRRESIYQATGVLPRLKIYYACSTFLAWNEPQFANACELIDSAAIDFPPSEWPEWLIERCLGSVISVLPAGSEHLLAVVDRHVPSALRSYICSTLDTLSVDLWRSSDRVRRHVQGMLFAEDATSDELRFGTAKAIVQLEAARKHTPTWDRDGHAKALESLIELAGERPSALTEAAGLLASQDVWGSIWEHRETQMQHAVIAERLGQRDQALDFLFQSMRAHQADGLHDEARGIRVRMEELDATHALTVEAKALIPDPEASGWPRRRSNLRILFVGGNETQNQYHKGIRDKIKEDGAPIDVEFMSTGWGNWASFHRTIEGRLQNYDGIIIMQFTRTTLGQRLRQSINEFEAQSGRKLPWHACTGRGFQSLYLSIITCARKIIAQTSN